MAFSIAWNPHLNEEAGRPFRLSLEQRHRQLFGTKSKFDKNAFEELRRRQQGNRKLRRK